MGDVQGSPVFIPAADITVRDLLEIYNDWRVARGMVPLRHWYGLKSTLIMRIDLTRDKALQGLIRGGITVE